MKILSAAKKAAATKPQQQQRKKNKTQHTLLGLLFLLQPQAQPQNLKTTVEMQNSDWLKFLIPRGTTGNFLIFLKSAVEHVWEAPAS